jgi:hypothetical protein
MNLVKFGKFSKTPGTVDIYKCKQLKVIPSMITCVCQIWPNLTKFMASTTRLTERQVGSENGHVNKPLKVQVGTNWKQVLNDLGI